MNAPTLLNELSDPTFYLIISMKTLSSITDKKIVEIYGYVFLTNEINTIERYLTGPTEHVQILIPLMDKKCRVFEDICFGT